MRKSYLLIVSCLAFLGTALAQEDNQFNKNYDPVRLELEEWDPIRGPWLSSSLEAMSKQEPIPDRTFPEDITPAQMVSQLPDKTRSNLERTIIANTNGSAAEQAQWNEIRRVVVRPGAGCGRRSARTYGDPHLVTFDGARYSFQTVGEFVLTKSTSGLEVQARQKPQRDDFSLNTAVAMNVGGDRVCIYASDYPDGDRSTPVRVGGRAVQVGTSKAYFLNNGGTIRVSGRTYTVAWPTGETVTAQIRRSGGMSFMNVNVQITDCSEGIFDGLLGNANGFEGDDFRGLNDRQDLRMTAGSDPFGSVSRDIEQRRLAFLANTMADQYRVTNLTTLFDYAPGRSTASFTDRSFPRVHRTFNEIPRDRRMAARRTCEQQGISSRDMNGCIFDNSHLNITPSPAPVVHDPTEGMEMKPVREVKPNVNEPITEADKGSDLPNQPRTPLPMGETKPQSSKGESIKTEPKPVKTESKPKPRYTTSPALERPSKPVRTTPSRTTSPTRSTPTRTTSPTRSTPTRTTSPTRSTPTRTTSPTRSTPTRTTSPTRSTPTRSTPTRSTPTRTTTPTRSTPTRSTPTRSTPTKSTPTRSTPTRGRG
ncbi:MAG: VWD domain-containing protein [Crocinitomicaceae bacterium]|nr:VWD domain-containing protein [Crocinitomicaceae bacterium]